MEVQKRISGIILGVIATAWVASITAHMYQQSVVAVVSLSCVWHFCDPMDCSPPRLLCPWNSPGKNTGVDYHFLLQGIFPTQGSNLHLEHCRQILYHWASSEALVSTIEMLLNPVFLFIPASLTALAQMSCLAFFFSEASCSVFPTSLPSLTLLQKCLSLETQIWGWQLPT